MIGVIGEALIDLQVDRSDPRHPVAHPGGSPMNVAITLGRLGSETAFFGRLADDAFGRLLRGHLLDSNVDLRWVVAAEEPTGLAILSIAEGGGGSYAFYVTGTADWQWTPGELPAEPRLAAVHAGSLALALIPGGAVVEAWLAGLAESTTVSLDPNVRPVLLGSPATYRDRLDRWIVFSRIVTMSNEDLEWIFPNRAAAAVARHWAASGTPLVVVTRGGTGSLVFAAGEEFEVPAAPTEMVDTVGAGDSFSGALLDRLSRLGRLKRGDIERLTRAEAEDAVRFASTVAAITCSRQGADPPRRTELADVNHI